MSKFLYIPQVGDKLKLTSNWSCKVFNESRNSKVFSGLNIDTSGAQNTNVDITFPKGTVLKVDRLYVRAPASSFDSITFRVDSSPIKSLNKARFWVKLREANNLEFETTEKNLDSFEKIKEAFRFMAMEMEFANSERLNSFEASQVAHKLYDYYFEKNPNELVITIPVNIAKIVTGTTEARRYWGYSRTNNSLQEDLKKLENLPQVWNIKLHLMPLFDGFLSYIEKDDNAQQLNDLLALESKPDRWGRREGSYLVEDFYQLIEKKTYWPALLSQVSDEDYPKLIVMKQNEKMDINSSAELQKLIKSMMPKKKK